MSRIQDIQLFTPDILDKINQVVVNAGLKLKKKRLPDGTLRFFCG